MNPELEYVNLSPQRNVLAFTYCKPDFDTPWHFHPQHELTYIWESQGNKFIGDYVGPYEPGELVLLRANLPHCWKNRTDRQGLCKSTVIQWNKGIFAEVPELAKVSELLRMAAKGLLFDRETVRPLVPRIAELPALDGQSLYVSLLQLLSTLTELPTTSLSASSFRDDLPREYSSRMTLVHDFVEANYHRKVYLKELAELVNMSEQSFSRFFSRMMGRPFFSFLNQYRISVARRLLIETDWSVSQIGFACGYESLPFFYKQFNKFMEDSPSKYRKQFLR